MSAFSVTLALMGSLIFWVIIILLVKKFIKFPKKHKKQKNIAPAVEKAETTKSEEDLEKEKIAKRYEELAENLDIAGSTKIENYDEVWTVASDCHGGIAVCVNHPDPKGIKDRFIPDVSYDIDTVLLKPNLINNPYVVNELDNYSDLLPVD